jgi:4-diphosphocytidyl-2-C-methyl-D-erythritol kinase
MTDVEGSVRVDPRRILDAIDPLVYERAHELLAPAKLNLRLKVLGRRADGYHLLSMLNVSSSLHDDLCVSLTHDPGSSISLSGTQGSSIATADNSVTRCFVEFWREFGFDEPPLGFRATLTKRIPIGAGLGGGSSDAGAMLRFLAHAVGMVLCQELQLASHEFDQRIMRVAERVGADVPYAYRGGVCWVTGIGEVVQELPVSQVWPGEVLITVPPAPVPTVAFYKFYREQHPVVAPTRDEKMEVLARSGPISISPELVENDFENDACSFVPEVETALCCARRFFPSSTSLTGSGSAIFSLVAPQELSLVEPYLEAASCEGMVVHRVRVLDGAASHVTCR